MCAADALELASRLLKHRRAFELVVYDGDDHRSFPSAMSTTIRPYVNGGWEVDIRLLLPDGTHLRERKKAPVSGKAAAQRWAEARERVLLTQGKPKPVTKEVQTIPTLESFTPRFIDGYARANRQKPSGIAAKESIFAFT